MTGAPAFFSRFTTRRSLTAAVLVAALVAGVALGEWTGWPFLAQPVSHLLSQRLDRPVHFDDGPGHSLRLRFLGGLRLQADTLKVEAPSWSDAGPTLAARRVALHLRYGDLLALSWGEPLRIKRLAAEHIALVLERHADGRASWQLGSGGRPAKRDTRPVFDGLQIDELALTQGEAELQDALTQLTLQVRFALRPGNPAGGATAAVAQTGMAHTPAATAPELAASAQGHYRGQPLRATLHAGATLSWLSSAGDAPSVPLTLDLAAGNAALRFDGTVRHLLGDATLAGRYHLRGPSLFAAGEPLGLTLPTTAPFSMRGQLDRRGRVWHTVVQQATVGRSQLRGEFSWMETATGVPMLSGQLTGTALWLADLGPAIGVPTNGAAADQRAASDRVLPQRAFNLPTLRAMNADVTVALDRLHLGTRTLSDIEPLNARLRLTDGILRLENIDARMAQGALTGRITLDGRAAQARWHARLNLRDLKLEDWIQAARAADAAPYVSGRLGVNLALTGQGRSTGELLGSADGRAVVHWRDGTVSHLLTEAAGLDIAQAIGVWVRGDASLPVTCGAADLDVKNGVITPRVMLVDSRDSTMWINGSLSLTTERLALVARVAPKDVSPLTLRTPVHVDGTLRSPAVSVEKGPLLRRLVPAALLAALNPLAALLPLVDTGDQEARAAVETCRDVAAQRLDRAPL